ncbi:alpha/beta hydrolase family protein [Streptomyces sp. NPDC048603]|uniref:alpha/beta hydrolase family protein n=1 Tax=Streptomyces sp. NPDC048603 TaxID=3365577 RepID=UPI00371D8A27
MRTPTSRRAAAAAVLALALALPVAAGTASAAPAPSVPSAASPADAGRLLTTAPELPRPTGPLPVGSTVLHLVDRSRSDPWVPTAEGRELMVTLHYPAARSGTGRPAPYATTEEAARLIEGAELGDGVSPAELSAMRTHSRSDARPAPGRRPLVVLSPGFSLSRYTLTALAEDLASRGYVVASVDHAYESFGIATPDGRVLGCVACTEVFEGRAKGDKVTAARAKDVSFVLDRLTGRHPVWKHAGIIDRKRIGMAGHSIGGAAAAAAMVGDARIRAGANMDGAFHDRLPAGGLGGRPFLMLGTDDGVHRPGGEDTSWDPTWRALGSGEKRWLTVSGTDHGSFTDAPVIFGHFGLPRPPIPVDRATGIPRVYLAAFFDRHLRGTEQPLLDGPSPANPEVVFHTP